MRLKKRRGKINTKKVIVLSSIFGVVLFMAIGYAILSATLSLNGEGNIHFTKEDEPAVENNCNRTIGVKENIYTAIEMAPGVYAKLEENGDIRVYGTGEMPDYGTTMSHPTTYIAANYFGGGKFEFIVALIGEIVTPGTIASLLELSKEEFMNAFEDAFGYEIEDEELKLFKCQFEYIESFADEYGTEFLNAFNLPVSGFWDWVEIAIPEASFSGHAIIEEGITKIADYSFNVNSGQWMGEKIKLNSVSLPSTLIEIGENAFSNNNLSSITIPANVTTIGGFAFGANPNLLSATVLGSNPQRFNAIWNGIFSAPRPPMP